MGFFIQQTVSEARPMAKFSRLLWSAVLFHLLAAGITHAQDLVNLRGTVKDPSGALISGASVTLKNDATHATRRTLTDATGAFSVTGVPAGQYTIQVQREGFATLSQPVLILFSSTPAVDLTLGVSAVSTSVDVRASREEVLETLSPSAVSVVYPDDTRGEFKSLPDLLDEIPGVYVRRVSGSGQYTTASIRGGAPTQVNIYVDGVPFNLASEVAADLSTLPISNVERVEVYRGDVPARFSGAPVGGAINIVTKKPTSFSLTGSSGARTLGGRQFSFALNGPVLRGKFLFGGDLEKSLGDFAYTDFVDQQAQTLILPANSYWGAVPICQVSLLAPNGCGGLINKTRFNNSFSKENLLTKWQTDRFSAKWSYLYMNRKMPYPTNQSPQADDPSGMPQYTLPRYQVLHQTEGVLGWNEQYGKLTTSLIGNIMDQDKQFYWLYPPQLRFGGSHTWYHTRRYGTEADLSYDLAERALVAQRFEFHGEWNQETLHTMIATTNSNAYTGVGVPPSLRRHTVSFQLQDTITLRFLHNLEITPVGRMQRLTGPVMGNIVTPFSSTTGDQGWKPTGSVAVKERFGHGWQAYSTYGRYVRYPNLYEIYGDSINIIPRLNSDGSSIPLTAELGRTADLGVGWDGTLTTKLSGHARLTFFRRQTDNNITLEQTPLYSYYENTGDTINRGIEFEGSLHYGSFASLQTAATIQDGWYTDKGFFAHDFGSAIFPAPGLHIPTLNSPYGTGDARLDLHFLRGGALTTFFEAKYVGQNPMNISSTEISLANGQIVERYDGREQYERPLTTLDLGIHLKLPHGGTFSSGVTDLLNRGPNQAYGGYIPGNQYSDGLHVVWYTCSTTGVKYPTDPPPSVCPSNDVVTSTAIVPIKQNLWFPMQGRTVYVLMSWDLKSWHPRRN
jgi:outer membrane receptor protein involved in Fe transport